MKGVRLDINAPPFLRGLDERPRWVHSTEMPTLGVVDLELSVQRIPLEGAGSILVRPPGARRASEPYQLLYEPRLRNRNPHRVAVP